MTTDPKVLLRLHMANARPEVIKQLLRTVQNPIVPYDPELMEEALLCVVCYQVPRHFRWIRTCANSHIQCRDCTIQAGNDRCSYCRSEGIHYKQVGLTKILENNAVKQQKCNYCAKQGTIGEIRLHEMQKHRGQLTYIPHDRLPSTKLTLDIADWISIVTCDFCDSIFLPGEPLTQCVNGHSTCNRCRTLNNTCIVDQCDHMSRSRPRTLEKAVTLIHMVQTFSCSTGGCQFRSTILIVLAHVKICYNPTFNLPFNDYRHTPNSTLEIIQFRRPAEAEADRGEQVIIM